MDTANVRATDARPREMRTLPEAKAEAGSHQPVHPSARQPGQYDLRVDPGCEDIFHRDAQGVEGVGDTAARCGRCRRAPTREAMLVGVKGVSSQNFRDITGRVDLLVRWCSSSC